MWREQPTCETSILEKVIVDRLKNKFTVFYETQNFITVFTKAHH
jgi:hypothetical protein